MKLIRHLGALGFALALVLYGAPAHAVPLEYNLANLGGATGGCLPFIVAPGPNNWARACITQFDNINIDDTLDDSSSVGVHWRFKNGNRRGLCRWTGGDDTTGNCDKQFNNNRIEWRVGRCDSDHGDCSTIGGYRDWTIWNQTQPGEL